MASAVKFLFLQYYVRRTINYILRAAYFSSFPVTKYRVALSNVVLQFETQALKGKVHPRTAHEGP